jgi:2-methylcitrate dehydratase PrpD
LVTEQILSDYYVVVNNSPGANLANASEAVTDLSHALAAAAATTRLEQLSQAAIDTAKKSILDTVAVALAASGLEPSVGTVIDLVQSDGGRAEATAWGLQWQGPATSAAFVNGALAHCLDFDDQTRWGQHAGSSVVPASLALAERRGGVRGSDLVAGVATGQDLFARLRRHVGWRKDWNLSSALGVYAGAAAASRTIGLPAPRVHAALGIASQQSSGVMEVVAGTGSDLRAVYAGFSARGATTSTLLAERGLGGVDRLFEGPFGVFQTYFNGVYDRDAILADLGKHHEGVDTLYKIWPSVGTSHSHIHATIELVVSHDLHSDDIEAIRVFVGDYHELMCTPLGARREPETLVDAKFSLPFLVGLASVRRTVGVTDFTEAGLRDPRVREAAAKVVAVVDHDLDWTSELPPGRVEIVTTDGRILAQDGAGYPGGPDRPTTWDQLAHKLRDCAAVAAHPPSSEGISSFLDAVQRLEELHDVRELLGWLR